MADLARLRRLIEGTLPPSASAPRSLTPEERRTAVRRAWWSAWERARPLPAPLDRLSPAALAALRARS